MDVTHLSPAAHLKRQKNLLYANTTITKCLRKEVIQDYIPGQVIYNLGEYPNRFSIAPTPYDADVLAILVDQTDFTDPDCIIDPRAGLLALWRGSHWAADVGLSFGRLRSCEFGQTTGLKSTPDRCEPVPLRNTCTNSRAAARRSRNGGAGSRRRENQSENGAQSQEIAGKHGVFRLSRVQPASLLRSLTGLDQWEAVGFEPRLARSMRTMRCQR